MAVRHLLLHVGGGKCGSSTIQASFSATPAFRTASGGSAGYGAVTGAGRLLTGRALREEAGRRMAGALQSHPMTRLSGTDRLRARWDGLTAGGTLLLSREAWINGTKRELPRHVLPRFPGARATAIVFVRPQVDHANSAWWQWGAWGKRGLADWIRWTAYTRHWSDRVDAFRRDSGIERVEVRLLGEDIVGDCLAAMGCARDAVPMVRANPGLPAEVLRLYQRHPHLLRPGPHESSMDFFLRRHVDGAGRPPWVISRDKAASIIAAARPSNERLLALLPEADRHRMESDPRWWDAEFYADREVEDWRPRPADAAASDALAARFMRIAFAQAKRR